MTKTPTPIIHDILDWLEATSEDPAYCEGSHEQAAKEIRRLRAELKDAEARISLTANTIYLALDMLQGRDTDHD